MASSEDFVLKDSPPEVIEASGGEAKGRTYSKECSKEPGAVRSKDLLLGTKLAMLSITDDKEKTLEKIGKNNPWHLEAMKMIVGSEEEALQPLSTILSKHFDLTLDTAFDVTGISKGGHALDTQGYIAHNDEILVLAYRCALNIGDWVCNLSATTSSYNPEQDLERGHSGKCSCLAGRQFWCCGRDKDLKPRVHTGFYNNFLASMPMIEKYIEPLLKDDQPPRTFYVVGHSLGAALATVAACYFLLEFDWATSPHKLVVVTVGSPRVCNDALKTRVQEKMKIYRPLDKAVICRIVNNTDIVPSIPPESLQFQHLEKLVLITKNGEVLINPAKKYTVNTSTLKELSMLRQTLKERAENDQASDYDLVAAKIPRGMSDHQPDMYLHPLMALVEKDEAEP